MRHPTEMLQHSQMNLIVLKECMGWCSQGFIIGMNSRETLLTSYSDRFWVWVIIQYHAAIFGLRFNGTGMLTNRKPKFSKFKRTPQGMFVLILRSGISYSGDLLEKQSL